ncbi:MAG: hypothetical protein IPN17_13475 [Deltaproteobacteria bacterium]|nr:hypothetical protein [Deltaproteobacteria bacterium]
MATSKTARKSTAAPARALPPALKKNADRMVAMAKKRLTDAARKALARAREAHAEALRGTYELGQALALLKAPGMSEAAGFADGFHALCESEFEMRSQAADRLVRAVSQVSEAQFTKLKVHRVNALLDLAMATEADDTEAVLAQRTVTLWAGGPKLALAKATTEAIIEATKQVRAQLGPTTVKRPKGRTTTTAERTAATVATKRLRQRGCEAAVVKVFATKPGAPSRFVIDGLSQEQLETLTKR